MVRGLKRISRRKAHPLTVLFIADGVNEDMLRLVDNICIFASMRMSFYISLMEYHHSASGGSGADSDGVAAALSELYTTITDACADLLRRPKHLQTTVVEDNLLKVCTGRLGNCYTNNCACAFASYARNIMTNTGTDTDTDTVTVTDTDC